MSKKHEGHKMATGGVTGQMMAKFGRNLARAMHQANPGKHGASQSRHKSGGRGK